jgi:hypothetical protein
MSVSKCIHEFRNRYENARTGERYNICPTCGMRVDLTPLNTLRENIYNTAQNIKITRISSRYSSAI